MFSDTQAHIDTYTNTNASCYNNNFLSRKHFLFKMDLKHLNYKTVRMSLEVVIGPMFSGKSSYALSYVRRQRAIGKRVLVIKPDIDNRYSNENVLVTHDRETIPCMMWTTNVPLCNIDQLDYDCYVVEEAQFFNHLYHFCHGLVFHQGKNVLVVGLDGCAKQKKFGEILDVIPMASSVTKLNALCTLCCDGTPAPYTRKMGVGWGGEEVVQVDVGGAEKYVAVCLRHLTNDA